MSRLLLASSIALGLAIYAYAWTAWAASDPYWECEPAPTAAGPYPGPYLWHGVDGIGPDDPPLITPSCRIERERIAWCEHPVVCVEGENGPLCSIPGVPPCETDLNGDGVVGGADFARFMLAWGTQDAEADWDQSGGVGGGDFAIFRRYWGMESP